MRRTTVASMVAIVLGVACGDDAEVVDGGDASSPTDSSGGTTAPTSTSSVDTGSDTEVDTGDSGVDSGTDTGTNTDPDSSSSGDDESGTTGEPDTEYAALVVGALFTDDLEEAQALHDALASGGQEGATMLGDFGHDALLGTALLGSTPDTFLAIDRWTNLEGAATLYGDPAFAKAFGSLFAEPVAPLMFEHRGDWHGWGDLDAADGAPEYYFVVVRGTLAEDDLEAARQAHDGLAAAGEGAATGLGDVAHIVWLGVEDPHQFFAVDVWTSDDAIEAFYSDPAFVAGFSALFAEPPTIGVYGSTDWHQW